MFGDFTLITRMYRQSFGTGSILQEVAGIIWVQFSRGSGTTAHTACIKQFKSIWQGFFIEFRG